TFRRRPLHRSILRSCLGFVTPPSNSAVKRILLSSSRSLWVIIASLMACLTSSAKERVLSVPSFLSFPSFSSFLSLSSCLHGTFVWERRTEFRQVDSAACLGQKPPLPAPFVFRS